MNTNSKIRKLCELFRPDDRVLIAFSGGVDSTFLLYALSEYCKLDVKALTIQTPYIPGWEATEASGFCKDHKIEHDILKLPFPKSIITNPGDRCYRCKHTLFNAITEYASKHKYNIVADGSNVDDTGEHRPGIKALKELKIRSPLIEAGFTKKDIRQDLKEAGLEIWNKPAYACLLTRLPHDIRVDTKELFIIEEAEIYLKELGFEGTRVRLHKDIARLECSQDHFSLLTEKSNRDLISDKLKQLGIKFVTIDIDGYRTGSMNKL